MREMFRNLTVVAAVALIISGADNSYAGGGTSYAASGGSIYDDPLARTDRPARRVNNNAVERRAMMDAQRKERQAQVEAIRKEREKENAKRGGTRYSEMVKKNAARRDEYQTNIERKMYLMKQIPIDEGHLLRLMNDEQKQAYKQEKSGKWTDMTLEERLTFVNDYQTKINKQVQELAEKQRLDANIQ